MRTRCAWGLLLIGWGLAACWPVPPTTDGGVGDGDGDGDGDPDGPSITDFTVNGEGTSPVGIDPGMVSLAWASERTTGCTVTGVPTLPAVVSGGPTDNAMVDLQADTALTLTCTDGTQDDTATLAVELNPDITTVTVQAGIGTPTTLTTFPAIVHPSTRVVWTVDAANADRCELRLGNVELDADDSAPFSLQTDVADSGTYNVVCLRTDHAAVTQGFELRVRSIGDVTAPSLVDLVNDPGSKSVSWVGEWLAADPGDVNVPACSFDGPPTLTDENVTATSASASFTPDYGSVTITLDCGTLYGVAYSDPVVIYGMSLSAVASPPVVAFGGSTSVVATAPGAVECALFEGGNQVGSPQPVTADTATFAGLPVTADRTFVVNCWAQGGMPVDLMLASNAVVAYVGPAMTGLDATLGNNPTSDIDFTGTFNGAADDCELLEDGAAPAGAVQFLSADVGEWRVRLIASGTGKHVYTMRCSRTQGTTVTSPVAAKAWTVWLGLMEETAFVDTSPGPVDDVELIVGSLDVTNHSGAFLDVELPLLLEIGGSFTFNTTTKGNIADPGGSSLALHTIHGSLIVQGNTVLQSLVGLENLLQVRGDLTISSNVALTSLNGLQGLQSVGGGTLVSANASLTSLGGMESLETVAGSFTIEDNTNAVFTQIDSGDGYLNALTSVGGSLIIRGNTSLETVSLNALQTVTQALTIGGPDVGDPNPLVETLSFGVLQTVGALTVQDCDGAAGIDGLLLDLPILNTVQGTLSITENDQLLKFDSLSSGLTGGDLLVVEGDFLVFNNDALPCGQAVGLRDRSDITGSVVISPNVAVCP